MLLRKVFNWFNRRIICKCRKAILSLIKNCNPENKCNSVLALIPNSTLWKLGKVHESRKNISIKLCQI